MRKIIDAIKDFIYNITDYGLIIVVIVIMVSVLTWRFDLLFNRGIVKEVISQVPENIVSTDKPKDESPDQIDNPDESAEDPEENEPGENPNQLIATITIPAGSFPSKIGEILLNSNLIEDSDEFLIRALELGLDTRLQSGTFEIAVGTSLDNIIKIIANVN